MTETRALEILNEYVYGPRAFGKKPGDAALKAILAACAEERRAALTWAVMMVHDMHREMGVVLPYNTVIHRLESERDAEGR